MKRKIFQTIFYWSTFRDSGEFEERQKKVPSHSQVENDAEMVRVNTSTYL